MKTVVIQSLYDAEYAALYPALYLHPWPDKHDRNLRKLSTLLSELGPHHCRWLDLACGQAWHFSQAPGTGTRLGLDLSLAQLAYARRANPDASLVCADMSRSPLSDSYFDLVTCFWAAYCYLDGPERIVSWLRQAIGSVREGGTMYLEVLPPEYLESFNRSSYAGRMGFSLRPRTPDYTVWSYLDVGGEHLMTSPALELFTDRLSTSFGSVEVEYDNGFLMHVVARGRLSGQVGAARRAESRGFM